MKINVVSASTPAVFDAIVFPSAHTGTHQFLQNQFANISATIMDSGRQFFDQGREMVQKFCDGTMELAARAAARMARAILNPNSIQRYTTLPDIQCAPPLMQRYIMTDPWIREKYDNQQCSGYSGSYVDLEPGRRGEDHYDWRRVNNGIVHFNENDDGWKATTYLEELRHSDRELHFDEQMDILSTQAVARLFGFAGEDPTCPFGSKIG